MELLCLFLILPQKSFLSQETVIFPRCWQSISILRNYKSKNKRYLYRRSKNEKTKQQKQNKTKTVLLYIPVISLCTCNIYFFLMGKFSCTLGIKSLVFLICSFKACEILVNLYNIAALKLLPVFSIFGNQPGLRLTTYRPIAKQSHTFSSR